MKKSGKVHLERSLSKLGVASRGQTKDWILQGRLAVDGRIVRDPDFLVVLKQSKITVDGKLMKAPTACTVMLHKPRGYVTTKSDEKGRKTVYDLLPKDLQHLHPVGRLDMATSGLLLMTTDTQLSNFLTDPVNAVPRTYVVTVKGRVSEEDLKRLSKGIEDQGEFLKLSKITLRKVSHKESHLIVELCEGKNREIRRMFKAVGHEIISLKRTAFGLLTLDDLPLGQLKIINEEEVMNGL